MNRIFKIMIVLSICTMLLINTACSIEKPEPDTPKTQQADTPPAQEEDKEDGPTAEEIAQAEKEAEAVRERIDAIEAMFDDPFMVLVNREHKLSSDFEPKNLVSFRGGYPLNKTCAEQLEKLIDAGKAAGYNYVLYSGYRTYSSQHNKYYNKISYYEGKGYSKDEAVRLTDLYYAPPGASEHQTGLAADVCIPSIVNKYNELHDAYAETDEFKWFSTHAHEYGFILRYRLGDEEITGYAYEPWHFRYVGIAAATEIYQLDVTYEEYIEGLQKELNTLKAKETDQ